MTDAAPSMAQAGRSGLQVLVTGLLSLAVAYRQGQVVFDIPPMRGELLAFIAVLLWVACGFVRVWRSGASPASRIEWVLGGGLVGVLLGPHVPSLATLFGVATAVFAVVQIAMAPREGIQALRTMITARPALILAAGALLAFAMGGGSDWLGLAFLVLAGCLMAWQSGRHLWLWSEGLAPVR